MAQKDAKDILRDMKAEKQGVDPKSIEFKDLRQNKRIKKKVKKNNESESGSGIIDNNEGFALSMDSQYVDFKELCKKGRIKEKSSLDEWGPFDFFRFAKKLYYNRYKKDWDLNIGGSSLEINRIKDQFIDVFGYCCNLMIYDYIIYFFDNYLDYFVNKNGFYFSQLRKDYIILSFQESYNFRERFLSYMTKQKQKNKKYELTKDEIQKSYDMGDMSLVGNYGVVVSLNWLLKVKKINKKEAVKVVIDACRAMYKKHLLDVVKSATEIHSPYPDSLAFKSPQLIFDKIDKDVVVNVEFENNNKMIFLQKGENKS